MRFLLDESADARLGPYLVGLGHDVTRIAADYPAGLSDPEVLALAVSDNRILITFDRDFGEIVFRESQIHTGVVYFRLERPDLSVEMALVDRLLRDHSADLQDFVTVTERRIRVRRR
jgi:predicted nuclease of predicted toxin-antitoxin system